MRVSTFHEEHASGKKDGWPELASCLRATYAGDTLLVWKPDRLGGELRHLVNTVHDLTERIQVGLASARARGRKGSRPCKMAPAMVLLAMAGMGHTETKVGKLCEELGISGPYAAMFPRWVSRVPTRRSS